MREYSVKFELVTGTIVEILYSVESRGELNEFLNTENQWIGTGAKKVNMNHVTHFIVEPTKSF